MIVRPFNPDDFLAIELQSQQEYLRQYLNRTYFEALTANAITVIADDRIIAIAGVKLENDIGQLWCFLSVHAARHMVAVHRIAARLIETYSERLIATTEEDFQPGERWLEMLGFEFLEVAEHFGPDNRHHKVYWH
jgi:hypothetical protein